ncbi:molecular chaperone DnaJ [Pajaroellobacter abortibovis]|uniref:Chaperone protein DnaJ n=1 Tax=Pajaroellobacter abortibovis TaxID=1882918 RepID=A0A1L6MVM2_9BACT|nr:J domain-containing protein [Pajaroellobacter abortibovis]APR99455.1 hypothetical protein BCY86_01230 [Pajaroellobacter abortibovis]
MSSSSEKRCFYEVLGCHRTVSPEGIRRAYKREALKHHPDRNPGVPMAEARFKEVNEAYQVLSNENTRRIYDRFGHQGLEGGGFDVGDVDVFSHMQDLFDELFSGGRSGSSSRRGAALQTEVRLSLREAAFGCKREVNVRIPSRCVSCKGTGAKDGTSMEMCSTCQGAGQVSSSRGFVMFTSTCSRCQGQGAMITETCAVCEGGGVTERSSSVMVSFPAGIDSGQRLRIPGQGGKESDGRTAGDLYIQVEVEEDPTFERDGVDLIVRVPVSYAEATLGAQIQVPVLEQTGESSFSFSLPPGTQPGTLFTIENRGIPQLDRRGRGALVVIIQVEVPLAVSDRVRELLGELDRELKRKEDGISLQDCAVVAQ